MLIAVSSQEDSIAKMAVTGSLREPEKSASSASDKLCLSELGLLDFASQLDSIVKMAEADSLCEPGELMLREGLGAVGFIKEY